MARFIPDRLSTTDKAQLQQVNYLYQCFHDNVHVYHSHLHTHLHIFQWSFSRCTRCTQVNKLPRRSILTPFLPNLCILLGQAKTFRIVLDTIPPSLFLTGFMTSILIQRLSKSESCLRSTYPNNLILPRLNRKVTRNKSQQ